MKQQLPKLIKQVDFFARRTESAGDEERPKRSNAASSSGGRTKPFKIGFVQCFLRHRGHSASFPRNRIRKLLGMTECPQSSRGVDFIEYLLRDSPNVDVALTWNADKQKAPRDARPKALVLLG